MTLKYNAFKKENRLFLGNIENFPAPSEDKFLAFLKADIIWRAQKELMNLKPDLVLLLG